MTPTLQSELEYLLTLPTPDLLRELEACRERWMKKLTAPTPATPMTAAEVTPEPAAPAADAAPAPEVAVAPPSPSGMRQRSTLITGFTAATIPGLPPHLEIVYTTVDALRGLFDLYPGATGLADLGVNIENGEPCMASELILLVSMGDIEPSQAVEIDTAELRTAVAGIVPRGGTAALALAPAPDADAPTSPAPVVPAADVVAPVPETPVAAAAPPPAGRQRSELITGFKANTIPGLAPDCGIVAATVEALRGLFDLYPGATGLADLGVKLDTGEPCMASELILLVSMGDIEPTQTVEIEAADLRAAVEGITPRA